MFFYILQIIMKKFKFLSVFILSVLFFWGSLFANYDSSQLAKFVQIESTKNGQERTQEVYYKLNQKLSSLSWTKKEFAQMLIEELKKNIDNNLSNTSSKIIKREDVWSEYKWNLKDIYQDDAAIQADVQKALVIIDQLSGYKWTLNDNSKLLEYLKLNSDFKEIDDRLWVYISLSKSVDNTNTQVDSVSQQESILWAKYLKYSSFFNVETKEFSSERLQSILNDSKFSDYRWLLQGLDRSKKRILSQDQEDIVAKLSDMYVGFSTIRDDLIGNDVVYPQIKDPQGNMISTNYTNMYSTWNNTDREFRKDYTQKFYNTYISFKNTLWSLFISHIKEAITNARVRNYENVLQMAYERYNLDNKIYDNLLTVTKSNLATFHRYLKLRKNYLNLDEMHYYDTFVSINDFSDKRFTYEEWQKMIINGLSALWTWYTSLLQKAFDNNWVDVYQSDKKDWWAFTNSAFGAHPFVSISFNNTFDDIDTLAHELWHAMNMYLSAQKQPYGISSISYPVEIASITNEFIFLRWLAENASSDKEKLFYLDRYLSILNGNYWRSTMYGDFEKQMYEKAWSGDVINTDLFDNTFESLFKQYYWPDFAYDKYLSIERAIKPHFYSTYYTHQYALSTAAANQIATNIYNKKDWFLEKYINYLSAWTSKDPADLLKDLGIDMTQLEYIKSVSDTENKILDEMDVLVSRIKAKN